MVQIIIYAIVFCRVNKTINFISKKFAHKNS